jgi:Tfp pilus assembly protein PilZ
VRRETGIGVEFSDEDVSIIAKTESYLGGSLTSEWDTHTL